MQTLQAHQASTHLSPAQSAGRTIELAPGVTMGCFTMKFARNEEVFAEEEDADFVYKVISGAVRAVRILSDGRRQIGAFHLPGDVFGLECGDTHRHSVEAVSDCEIALVRRAAVDKAAQADGSIARALWRATSGDMQRLQDHMMRLGRETALERVVSFLIEVSARCAGKATITLPMGRIDIADYLGLTIETVSRTLTQLERDRAISMPSSRCIELHGGLALAVG
jgi:CRP/FNR family nitrogen fixation transcriptional regulator